MVVLQCPGETARRRAELGALARYCAHRIETELGSSERWVVSIAPVDDHGYACRVEVGMIDASASGRDSALAIWDAMCRIACALRDRTPGRDRAVGQAATG